MLGNIPIKRIARRMKAVIIGKIKKGAFEPKRDGGRSLAALRELLRGAGKMLYSLDFLGTFFLSLAGTNSVRVLGIFDFGILVVSPSLGIFFRPFQMGHMNIDQTIEISRLIG